MPNSDYLNDGIPKIIVERTMIFAFNKKMGYFYNKQYE